MCTLTNKYIHYREPQMKDHKNATYRYVLYQGNNPTVIQEALVARRVWTPVSPEKILTANFIWKPLGFVDTLYDELDEILRYDKDHHVLLNHFQNNNLISTKSGLVRSLRFYYSHQNGIYEQNYHVFETIPTTFIVNPGKKVSELKDFLERFAQIEMKNFIKEKMPQKHCQGNVWYIKPESANQGRGITLTNSLKQIQSIIHSKSINTYYILQKSIEKPLLYKGRKFDVRVWALVTPNLEVFWYKVPYIRTSSFAYNSKDLSQQIHLTNNFQQKKHSEYSKHEQGNTIPFDYLKEELIEQGKENPESLMIKILQRIKALIVDTILSVKKWFLRNVKKKEFQLFGFDFLIDQDLRTWLIEVNDNPYIGTPNKFIKGLIPNMINEMFEIILDPIFPPVDYQPVEVKNFQLLHKEISFYRINPIRSGSTDNKRKNYYPLNDQPQKNNSMKKNRRNSQALSGFNSFESTEKHLKVRYSTPVETVKYLLDTYCFNDLEPFLVPVNFILTSPKLKENESLGANVKNLKLITETRICNILLEPKFLMICKEILNSKQIHQDLKSCILSGYYNAIRSHKNRVDVIRNIVPTFKEMIKQQKQPEEEEEKSNLMQGMIMLLIRLGGNIDRKIFIPGETREKETSREFFISSNALKILMYFKEKFPKLCTSQVQGFFSNLNSKDWELYEMTEKNQENAQMSASEPVRNLTEYDIEQKFNLNISILNEAKKRRSSYSEKFHLGSTLPKLKK